ncbi:hypothetical protein HPP92_006792 [Vanilla planifolia]|uniref:soluble epoxide hydrolase n=1 Tax=Vanilla planifolia TaxID=51239 RepID=A0A835RJ31_VANPL|nr:hypothetical protein HPP92_006792 [Vanilla planifolia]
MEAEGINHRMVEVNGIKLHVAEKGEGQVVLFVHGFPDLWYTWRHQIVSLADRGYHAVAPDLRGYGDSDAPSEIAAYSILHIVGDLVALIDSLGQDKVFVVGHDWGAIVAWSLCIFRPDKVKALVNLSVPFLPRHFGHWRVGNLRALYGDDFYVCRFQEPGVIEAQFAQVDTASLMKSFLTARNARPLMIPKEQGFTTRLTKEIILPSWLSKDDVNYYASKFIKTGFRGGVNYYRNIDTNWELTAPWNRAQVKVPTKFIIGDVDLVYHMGGMKDYIHKGGFKIDVPLLKEVVVLEDVAHFLQQEKADEVSDHIYEFIRMF